MRAAIVVVVVLAGRTVDAAPAHCMIVNASDQFLVFASGKQRVNVPEHRAGSLDAGTFSATATDGKAVLVRGECKPGDRIEIVARAGKLEPVALVLATGKTADATSTEVAAYLKRAYKTAVAVSDLCLRRPAFAPELLVVSRKGGSDHCLSPDRVLGRDASGALVTIDEGGFGWPEPYVEPQVARGGSDAEQAALLWTLQVEWSFAPLDAPTDDFKSKYAPAFFPPRVSTHGDAVWVDAWRSGDADCYVHVRRVHEPRRHLWSEEQIESFCVDEGNIMVQTPDGRILRNGKPVATPK